MKDFEDTKPPRLAQRLFRWYCADPLVEEIEGDLEERFLDHLEMHGPARARRNYWLNVMKFFRWHTIKKRRSKSHTQNHISMFKSYFKIAFRSALKQKAYSFINLSGLAVGLTSFILILLYVQHQVSFDEFHEKKERLYRIHDGEIAITANVLGPYMQRSFTEEVQDQVRLLFMGGQFFKIDDNTTSEGVLFADQSFFSMFTFPLQAGSATEVLTQPNSMVFSAKAAIEHFGSVNAVGETFEVEGRAYQVTGIMADLPANSTLQFDYVAPLSDMSWAREETWGNRTYFTYLLLAENVDPVALARKAEAKLDEEFGVSSASKNNAQLAIQPLQDIYLQKEMKLDYEPMSLGDITYVYIFTAIAGLILLIACVNYVNLSTSRSLDRAREVGIRKVVGAVRGQLVGQFLGESFLFVFGSLLISFGLCFLLLPYFEQLSGVTIAHDNLFAPLFLVQMAGLGFIITLLAGFYPALMLSAFKPVQVLKGSFKHSGSGSRLRKALVVFQFAISAFLLVATLVVNKQLNFIQNRKLGYNREHVLYFPMDGQLKAKREVLKSVLMANPNIQGVSFSSHVPVNIGSANGIQTGESQEDWELIYFMHADKNMMDIMGMNLLTGEDLYTIASPYSNGDSLGVKPSFIINEAAAALFNWTAEEAIGKPVVISGIEGPVQGVVENFHFRSLQQKIEPFVILYSPERFHNAVVKLSGENIKESLAFIEDEVAAMAPSLPLDITFLDDQFNRLYKFESRLGEVFLTFATIAIVIACLGMFGLISFVAVNRSKEIGIRKVLGASIATIMYLLSVDFLKLVSIALLVALPLGYYFMTGWLQDYAYAITMGADVALIAIVSAVVITLVTIGYQALKTALVNPAKVLRNNE